MKKRIRIVIIIIVIISIPLLIYSNSHIDVENITVSSSNLPAAFHGTKIVQISDYHNHGGKNDAYLMSIIKEAEPDYIVITGDSVDGYFTNIDKTISFLGKVVQQAPCYMIWGNHEMRLSDADLQRLRESIDSLGITLLDGDTIELVKKEDRILLTGNVSYPTVVFHNDQEDTHVFSIWLNHFPENFNEVVEVTKANGNQVDLMFSGHAHGGLVRLPFLKGVIAPGQGFFPQYTSGIYENNGSKMIVSRGLGNSGPTLRLFNPFHLVVCTLEQEQ